MNLKSAFLTSLAAPPKTVSSEQPEVFLGKINTASNLLSAPMTSILSSGSICASFPWTFDIKGLDCFLLLYTKAGCGKLLVDNQVFTLDASSFLFFNCSCRFRFDIAVAPWEYEVLFVQGDLPAACWQLLPMQSPTVIFTSSHSDIAAGMKYLTGKSSLSTLSSQLTAADMLSHILTLLLTTTLLKEEDSKQIPAYLKGIRELFEQNYSDPCSLDLLAEQYHVSKYRLCREFKAAYGYPPLQYLNRLRINMAKRLLTTSDLRVHEIGSRVGIDNTNHFISLFKKYTDTTPAEYRQRMS